MPALNAANDIRLGTDQVSRVYVGTEQVWPSIPTSTGIIQQDSGIWSGTTVSVSLPLLTSATSMLALIVAADTTVPTPAGWTLREAQVNWMGHYLFTRDGGTSSWSIPTANGQGTWCVVEIANATYESGASHNETWDYGDYSTLSVVPPTGSYVIVASIASMTDTSTVRTLSDWTNGFTEVADVCNAVGDYPMQGVAARSVIADGVMGVMTSATFSSLSVGRSAIIAAFKL